MGEVGMAVQETYTNKGSRPRDNKVHLTSLLLVLLFTEIPLLEKLGVLS